MLPALLTRFVCALQDAAKTGKPLDAIKLHECQCPPCFTEYRSADGTIDCKPKCDLDTCDERSGICQGGFYGGGGEHRPSKLLLSPWWVLDVARLPIDVHGAGHTAMSFLQSCADCRAIASRPEKRGRYLFYKA